MMFKIMMGRTDACVFSHIFKRCSAVMLGLKALVPQGLPGVQRPTEKIQGVQGGAGGNSVNTFVSHTRQPTIHLFHRFFFFK